MPKLLTLIYQGAHQPTPTEQTFATERELCQRVADIARDWDQVNFYLAQPDGQPPVWLSQEDIAARLAVIEARREAVAYALMRQGKGPDWARVWPTEEKQRAYWDGMLYPDERDEFRARADQLIAAYEGATA